jgi:4'-phosphopantetheinyl transferase
LPKDYQFFVASIKDPKYQELFANYQIDVTKYHPRQKLVGKWMLADYMGVSIDELSALVAVGPQGKPYLKDHRFEYNLANSFDLVILVVSDQSIGVDLEKIRPFAYQRIARAFNQPELDYLTHLDTTIVDRATLNLWTIKEATLKLAGVGLAGGVKSVKIDVSTQQMVDWHGRSIQITTLPMAQGYIGTLATYQ